jgi:hypothetical protein
MKKLISLILVFCMTIMLVPALAESADIAGEWTGSYAGQDIPMTINADGTFSMNGTEGTWVLEGEILSMTAQGQTMVFTYKDDVITFSQEDITIEFMRAAAEEAAPAKEAAPAEEKAVDVTFADVNPDAAAEDFNGEWCIQYIAAGDEVAANDSGEVTADIAIKDGGITFGSGSGFSEVFGDKALKMEYADGAFSYSRNLLGLGFSFRVEMLQDGMAAVTVDIAGSGAILYMIRIEAPAA